MYQCIDLKAQGDAPTTVAVKVLQPDLAENSEFRSRFLREARVQKQLQHPHIAKVFNVCEDDGLHGIVLEWMEGESLLELKERLTQPLHPNDICRLMIPVLEALEHAHQNDFIHRDIKLENIMVRWEDDTPVAKVADFGLVKAFDGMDELRTKTQTVMGTLSYMSPEQLVSAKYVESYTDIYSVGVCMYALATGEWPFDGNTTDQILAITTQPAPPPHKKNVALPTKFSRVILRCLEKQTEDRFESCEELALVLTRMIEVLPEAIDNDSFARLVAPPTNRSVKEDKAGPILEHMQKELPSGVELPDSNLPHDIDGMEDTGFLPTLGFQSNEESSPKLRQRTTDLPPRPTKHPISSSTGNSPSVKDETPSEDDFSFAPEVTKSTRVVSRCPQCHHENTHSSRFCTECQFPLMLLAGKYKLTRYLAQGGMARVYMAQHVQLQHDAERVIKVIKSDFFEGEEYKKRFWREIQVTSVVSQRNNQIVRIYDDFGEEDGLGLYYVMEHLQGETLREWMQREQPDDTLSFSILSQLCKAMDAAHRQGVIHRDLKPDNIFLQSRDNDLSVKVLDFGIARATEMGGETALTQGLIGTPKYMSPEQCRNGSLDQRSDLYSIALIFYEMLSGYSPYAPLDDQDEPEPSTHLTWLTAHTTRKQALLIHWRRDLPIELSDVLQKALSRDPNDRYPNVTSLWDAVQHARSTVKKESSTPPQQAPQLHTVEPKPSSQPVIALPVEVARSTNTTQTMLWVVVLMLLVLSGGLVYSIILKDRQATPPIVRTPKRKTPPSKQQPRQRKVAQAPQVRNLRPAPSVVRKAAPSPRPIASLCSRRGSLKRCQRCVRNNLKRAAQRSFRLSLEHGSAYRWVCQRSYLLHTARRCRKSCACNYLYFCASYLRQRFHVSRSRARRGHGGQIASCRKLVGSSSVRTQLVSSYEVNLTNSSIQQCKKNWNTLK